MKQIVLYASLLGITSCLFSGNDLREVVLIKNYYLSLSGNQYSIVKKEMNANTDAVIINEIDSIGLNGSLIIGVSQNEYFVVNTETGSNPIFFHKFSEISGATHTDEGSVVLQPPSVLIDH